MVPSDDELIGRSKAGDTSAFEQLIFRYDRDVLTIASRFTKSAEDAKDIYQESFIRVYKGLPKFEGASEFTTWLYRIVTNVCLSHRARKRRTAMDSLDEGGEEGNGNSARSDWKADDGLHSREISGRIDEALKELSPQQRLVFTLRHYQEYKLREIAQMMDCSEGTVKRYLFEATKRMRKTLQDLND